MPLLSSIPRYFKPVIRWDPDSVDESPRAPSRGPKSKAPEALQGQMSPQSDLWSAGSTQLRVGQLCICIVCCAPSDG